VVQPQLENQISHSPLTQTESIPSKFESVLDSAKISPESFDIVQPQLENQISHSPLTQTESIPSNIESTLDSTPTPQASFDVVQPQLQAQTESAPIKIESASNSTPTPQASFDAVKSPLKINQESYNDSVVAESKVLPKNSPVQLTPIQTRQENPSLNVLKPLGNSQGHIPDSWTSIADLLNASSTNKHENQSSPQPLGFTKSLLSQNKSDLKPELSVEQTKAKKLSKKYNNTKNPKSYLKVANSWSSISELLDNYPESSSNQYQPAENQANKDSPNSVSAPAAIGALNFSVDDEKLEQLAQYIYTLLRQKLEIEQERQGHRLVGSPHYLSNLTSSYGAYAKYNSVSNTSHAKTGQVGSVEKMDEVDQLNNKLQVLSNAVYLAIARRLETERELQGNYYFGRLRW